ncbi:MAG: helix-turn-helix transcriptional regulator [Bacteroidia bacterium]|nr:helix-turn-helix transcriptional regulator [Bacteroidia bacterium]
MEIGKRIKDVAERKKISAVELADELGKSRQAIYDIYKGKVSVNIDLLEKIALALDEPMVSFLQEPAKPSIDRQALREIISEIIKEIMTRYYIHYSDLQELSKEIHDKAKEGEGLVNLRVKRTRERVEITPDYRKLKNNLPEKELAGYADRLLDDFFNNLGPLWDRVEVKKLINKFFDEKGEGYIMKILT